MTTYRPRTPIGYLRRINTALKKARRVIRASKVKPEGKDLAYRILEGLPEVLAAAAKAGEFNVEVLKGSGDHFDMTASREIRRVCRAMGITTDLDIHTERERDMGDSLVDVAYYSLTIDVPEPPTRKKPAVKKAKKS